MMGVTDKRIRRGDVLLKVKQIKHLFNSRDHTAEYQERNGMNRFLELWLTNEKLY